MLDHFIKYLAAYQLDSQTQDEQSQGDDQSQQVNITVAKDQSSEHGQSESEEESMEYVYPKRRGPRAGHHLTHRRRRSTCAPIHPSYITMSPQYWIPSYFSHPYPMSSRSPPMVPVPVILQAPQPWTVANGRPMPPGPLWPNPAMTQFPYF
ncbi:hypothetical protein BJV82DRAFT_604445 [Fennellomyces sp. T-0311]|nr:hypothetical protein BJV82DRAFT_604445 [Fennellomyces sp. T-0311]